MPVPQLTRNHVILALDYASVGPWDAKQRSGAWGPIKPGTILGADGSGTVVAVAADVTRLRVGDRVYSYSYGNPQGGFYAEYISLPADRVERAFPNGIARHLPVKRQRRMAVDLGLRLRTIPLKTEEYSLDQVVDAHRRLEQGHVEGKIVLRIRR